VAGIGGVTYANSAAALSLVSTGDRLKLGLFATTATSGQLTVALPGADPFVQAIALDPAHPFVHEFELPGSAPAQGEVAVTLTAAQGEVLLDWRGPIR
jgi:hypothetical protein